MLRYIRIFYVIIVNVSIIVIFTFHRNFLIEPKITMHFCFVNPCIVGFIFSYFIVVIRFTVIFISFISLASWYVAMHFLIPLHVFISKLITIIFWTLSILLFYFSMHLYSILIFISFLFVCFLFLTAIPSNLSFSQSVRLPIDRNFLILTSNLLVLVFVRLSLLSSVHSYLFIFGDMYFFAFFLLILFLWIISFGLEGLFLARWTALRFCTLFIFKRVLFRAILFSFTSYLLCCLVEPVAILFIFICPLKSFFLLVGSSMISYYFPYYSFDLSQ